MLGCESHSPEPQVLLLNVIKCVLADVVGYDPGSISEHIVCMCIHDNTALFEFPLHHVGLGSRRKESP